MVEFNQSLREQMTSSDREILFGILLISLLITGVIFIWIEEPFEEKIKTVNSHYSECVNMSLKDTAYCLRDYVDSIYIYTITDDDKKLTLEELKTIGGDCRDWNLLHEQMAKELGFNSHSFHIEGEGWGHRVAFIVGDRGYCLLDQTAEPKCFNA